MKRKLLALAAALVFPAGAANADVPTHCAPSDPAGVFACASMLVSFESSTGIITVKIQNTDIWAQENGVNPVGHGYSITGFGITGPDLGEGVTMVGLPTTEGSVEIEGTPADEWTFVTGNLSGFTVEAGASANGINGGILGCNDEFGNQWFRTCTAGENTGYVVFQFDTELTALNLSEVTLALRAQGGDFSYRCEDPNCVPPVVPEPISMLLLGTGLLGVGGVQLRRRRKEENDA